MTGQVFVNRWSKQAESGKCCGRKTYAERDPQACLDQCMFSPNEGCGLRIMPRPELVEGLCELMPVYTIFDHDIPLPHLRVGRVINWAA
jgi:hypothetical protein